MPRRPRQWAWPSSAIGPGGPRGRGDAPPRAGLQHGEIAGGGGRVRLNCLNAQGRYSKPPCVPTASPAVRVPQPPRCSIRPRCSASGSLKGISGGPRPRRPANATTIHRDPCRGQVRRCATGRGAWHALHLSRPSSRRRRSSRCPPRAPRPAWAGDAHARGVVGPAGERAGRRQLHQPPAATTVSSRPTVDLGPGPGPDGCDELPLGPTAAARPPRARADSASGLRVNLSFPQEGLDESRGARHGASEGRARPAVTINPWPPNGLKDVTAAPRSGSTRRRQSVRRLRRSRRSRPRPRCSTGS